ncbi:MAG TPA: putative glycoside hydrolase [Acidimicrobiia bacterium]|nr:putative glycoside hydrolase [Acidimicrobiia bacterium]
MPRRLVFRFLVAATISWAGWAVWSLTGSGNDVTVTVIDDVGLPIDGAEIHGDESLLGVTGNDGRLQIAWSPGLTMLTVSATGYSPLEMTMLDEPATGLEAVLRANLLRGRVLDEEENPVAGAYISAGTATAVTDAEGRFTVRKAEPGRIEVWRPAWDGKTISWSGGLGEELISIAPQVKKAVHVGGEAARDNWDFFVDLANDTEINSLMLDLKDESGLIFYLSEVAIAQEMGATVDYYDLPALAAEAEEQGIYLIGRVVAFQDPLAAIRSPEMAVWDAELDEPYAAGGQYFLDPTDPAAQAYALDLGVEACKAGVDEIQFDYVRFPDSRRDSARFDGGVSEEVRTPTIRDFLATAVAQLHPLGCAVAADIFGFLTKAIDDGGIGQRWEDLTEVLDVASPMVYPSHYASGWGGFTNPNDYPAEMVGAALDDGLERLTRQTVVRPWLQDFGYTPDQVRAQIEEAESRGLGWMLWNAQSNVSVEALRPNG